MKIKKKKNHLKTILTSVSNRVVFDKGNSLIAKYVWHSKIRDEERPAIDPPNWVVFSVKRATWKKNLTDLRNKCFARGRGEKDNA